MLSQKLRGVNKILPRNQFLRVILGPQGFVCQKPDMQLEKYGFDVPVYGLAKDFLFLKQKIVIPLIDIVIETTIHLL